MENEIENVTEEAKGLRFANDLSDEIKERVKVEAAKRIEALLEKTDFSVNDIAQLSGVAHGSVKGRAKTLASANDIVEAILNGTRATGTKRGPSVESVKSFIDSLDAESRKKFMAELGLTEA